MTHVKIIEIASGVSSPQYDEIVGFILFMSKMRLLPQVRRLIFMSVTSAETDCSKIASFSDLAYESSVEKSSH
jgi:hypothetical protein